MFHRHLTFNMYQIEVISFPRALLFLVFLTIGKNLKAHMPETAASSWTPPSPAWTHHGFLQAYLLSLIILSSVNSFHAHLLSCMRSSPYLLWTFLASRVLLVQSLLNSPTTLPRELSTTRSCLIGSLWATESSTRVSPITGHKYFLILLAFYSLLWNVLFSST